MGYNSLRGADPGHVASKGVGIVLDVQDSTVGGIGLVCVLNGMLVNSVVDPATEPVNPLGERSGQVFALGAQLVVVVGVIQDSCLFASRATVHESFRDVLLALASDRAVHCALGGVLVAVDLSLHPDLGLIAVLAKADGFVVGQVKNVLAESVRRRVVPVANTIQTDGVVVLLVGGHTRSGSGVLLNAEVGEVLGVPSVLGDSQSAVEVDESTISLLDGEAGPQQMSFAALHVLEDAIKSRLELSGDGIGGEDIIGRRFGRLIISGLEHVGVFAALGGVLVLKPGLNGTGFAAFGLVADDVLAVPQVERSKSQRSEAVDVPFLEPLPPGGIVREVEFGVGEPAKVNSVALAKGDITLDGLIIDRDQVVGLLVLHNGLVAVGDVAGSSVRLDVEVLFKKYIK